MQQSTLTKLRKLIKYAQMNSVSEPNIAVAVTTMLSVVYTQTLDAFPEFNTGEFHDKFKMLAQSISEINTLEDVSNVNTIFSSQLAVHGKSFADTFDTYLGEYLDRWIMLLEKQN